MSDMWWSRGVGCGLVVVLAVGLAACRGGQEPTTPASSDSGASPTVEVSPTPSEDATTDEQELIDEAIAALTEYLALANEVENAGGEGWEEKLKPWWGSQETVEAGTAHFSALLENGWHTEGSTRLTKILRSVADQDGTVVVDYCLDGTGVRALDQNGDEFATVPAHPIPGHAELVRSSSQWQVLAIRTNQDKEC